jgi:CubicO group peptidase (beta-lactamase class C family)
MRFPRSSPEQQGVSSRAIERLIDALESGPQSVHSMMLVRHGNVIAEGWWAPYRRSHPHSLFSISKSFTSTAVGFAIEEGLLTLDDAVVDLLPDDLPDVVSENLAAMRLRHLLTMTTGHTFDTVTVLGEREENWSRLFLALPVDAAPGSTFVYNTGASYLLSAIVQRLTGERLLDYLTPRLLEPLGIADATWEQCPRGIDVGGWGLSITTEDIAAFGNTYLRGGVWNDRQVVPAHWAAEATRLQVTNGDFGGDNDNSQGYGYQFWLNRHGSYRADGAFGQLSIAFPEQDALLVLTGGVADAQRDLDIVWEHLLPVLGARELPADATAAARLARRLETLQLPFPVGDDTASIAARVDGTTFALPRNNAGLRTVTLESRPDCTRLTIVDAAGTHVVDCGRGEWTTGTSSLLGNPDVPVASAGTWPDDTSFLATVYFTETPFAVTVSLDFVEDGREVTVTVEQNVSFEPTRLLHTIGHAL